MFGRFGDELFSSSLGGTFSTILDAAEVFTPSINDITTYNRINESDYRVNYNVSGSELSMADIISRIS